MLLSSTSDFAVPAKQTSQESAQHGQKSSQESVSVRYSDSMLPWPKPVNWVPGLEPSINGGRSGNGSGSGSAAAVARVHRVDPSMCKSALSEPALRPISLMGRRLDGPATQSHSHMPDLEAGSRQLQHPRMHSAAQTSSRKGGGHSRFFFSKTAAPSQRENVAIARKQEGLPALRAREPRRCRR